MPLLCNVAIGVWMVVMSQGTSSMIFHKFGTLCHKTLGRFVINLFVKFLFCCSRIEHKSVIICCNVGRHS